jgi:predicted CoA-binding protein
MLRVFADAGLSVRRRLADDVIEVTMPIPGATALGADSPYLDAVAGREQRADVASLAPLLAPRSVAVVGASRREGSIGRTIVLNIRDAGFAGALFAVNPHAQEIGGVPCLPSVSDLPTVPDLVVVAVPSAQVSKVARECGKRGVRCLVVITSGLGVSGDARLLETCRQYGMRLVGPNCFGVAVPGLGLDATFATRHPQPGVAGLVVQSGGVGIALLDHLSRLGIGSRTGSPSWRCCTWNRSAARAGSPGPPAGSARTCRCSPCTPAGSRPASAPRPPTPRRWPRR